MRCKLAMTEVMNHRTTSSKCAAERVGSGFGQQILERINGWPAPIHPLIRIVIC